VEATTDGVAADDGHGRDGSRRSPQRESEARAKAEAAGVAVPIRVLVN